MSELLDNSRHRIETLKGIIKQLHDGADPESLKEEFGDLLAEVGVGEIAAMENSLMADGMEQAEIQRMCDVHAAVLGGAGSCAPQEVPAGHPVHTFQLENVAIREMVADYRTAIANLGGDGALEACRLAQQALAGLEVHYLRKEYLVFPYLEKAGIAGPPKVMWGVHDEIREKITEQVRAVADRTEIAWWYLAPEELRYWRKNELTYLQVASEAIHDADPLGRRTFPGRAEATMAVDMAFQVQGQLIERPVNVGDRVTKGQFLGRLDERDYQNDRDTAKARVDRQCGQPAKEYPSRTRDHQVPVSGAIGTTPRQGDSLRSDFGRRSIFAAGHANVFQAE